MANKRSASEVLLSLEDRIETLEGLARSIDHNVKLLLNNYNMINRKPIDKSTKQITPSKSKEVSKPKKKDSSEVVTAKVATAKTVTAESVDFVQVERDIENRKRTVQERLTYSNSKPIILAQVEIFDSSGNRVSKKNTNSKGMWAESLLPGEYKIRVAKGKTSVNPQVTANYELSVSPSEVPLQLEDRKL